MPKEKKLLFIKHGEVKPKHFEFRHKESQSGNTVLFLNGTLQSGFEESCSSVIMDCDNDKVTAWAIKNSIPVLDMSGKNLLTESTAVDTKDAPIDEDEDEDDSFGETVDQLVQSQVEKAEFEHVAESSEHDVPHISQVDIGTYKDPDGNVHERKKGPKLKDSFVDAIKKHGFESFVKV